MTLLSCAYAGTGNVLKVLIISPSIPIEVHCYVDDIADGIFHTGPTPSGSVCPTS